MDPHVRLTLSFPEDYYNRLVQLSSSLNYSFEDLFAQSLELYATMRAAMLKDGRVMTSVGDVDQPFILMAWPLGGGWTLERRMERDKIYSFGLSEEIYQAFIRLMDNSSSYPAEVIGSALGAYERGMQVIKKQGTVWVDLHGERCDIFVVDN